MSRQSVQRSMSKSPLHPPAWAGAIGILSLFAIFFPLLVTFFYQTKEGNLGLSPVENGTKAYFFLLMTGLSILLSFFLKTGHRRFLVIQILPVLLLSLHFLLPVKWLTFSFTVAIFITALNFLSSFGKIRLQEIGTAALLYLLVFAYLGFHHLHKSFWMDEFCVGASLTEGLNFAGYSIFESQYGKGELSQIATNMYGSITSIIRYDSHPPLSESLFYIVARAFGFDLATLRVFTLTVSALTVTSGFFFLWKSESLGTAAFYSGLMLASPIILRDIGIEVRPYFLLVALTQTSVLSFYRFIQKQEKQAYWVWVLSTALNLYTHYFAVLPIAAFFVIIHSAKRTALMTVLSRGIWLVAVLVLPAVQIALYQRLVKSEWLAAPDLHLTYLGLPQINSFFVTSFPYWLILFFILAFVVNTGVRFLVRKEELTFPDLKPGPDHSLHSVPELNLKRALVVGLCVSILLLLAIDFDILRSFFKTMGERYLPGFHKNTGLYAGLLIQLTVIGFLCLFFFRFPSLRLFPIEKLAQNPLWVYSLVLVIILSISIVLFVNFSGKIYSYRNAVWLLIPLFLLMASLSDFVARNSVRWFRDFSNRGHT